MALTFGQCQARFKSAVRSRRRMYDWPMRIDLMEILVCPMCRAALSLTADREDGGEVMDGKLVCTECGETYLIEDGIPNLLPPDMRD